MLLIGMMAGLLAASCGEDSKGYCTSEVVQKELSYKDASTKVRINCALGESVVLRFPENVSLRGEPVLGNRAVFEYRAQKDPFRILIWARFPQGVNPEEVRDSDLYGEYSNLQVFLDSGVSVMIDMRVAPVEKSVQQVQFTFPEREKESEYVREKIDRLAAQLENEHQEKLATLGEQVESRARKRLAEGMLKRLDCTKLNEREMGDLLVVRVHRLCRLGDLMFVNFSIKNRARDLFHLDRVEMHAAGAEEGAGVELQVEFGGASTTIGFNQQVQGVAVFEIEGDVREQELTVKEDGGQQRIVSVDGVGFGA